jgi:imidazole glycerol phosphate synthase glutamine amidotransferase subunit
VIGILDYGAGNLRSVSNTMHALGAPFALVKTAEELRGASKIILPGVGHFGQMMRALDAMDLRESLLERIAAGVPFFGICLGMQALFEGSDEAPEAQGLGLFAGRALRFPDGLRVPHMGWNQLKVRPGSRLFAPSGAADSWYYFAHSYYVPEVEANIASCEYSLSYTAAIERGNIFGVQFHPEKSAAAGQALVRAFLTLP